MQGLNEAHDRPVAHQGHGVDAILIAAHYDLGVGEGAVATRTASRATGSKGRLSHAPKPLMASPSDVQVLDRVTLGEQDLQLEVDLGHALLDDQCPVRDGDIRCGQRGADHQGIIEGLEQGALYLQIHKHPEGRQSRQHQRGHPQAEDGCAASGRAGRASLGPPHAGAP